MTIRLFSDKIINSWRIDMLSTLRMSVIHLVNALMLALLCIPYAHAETQFFEDFNGGVVDDSIWTYPTGNASFNGRTQMRAGYPSVSSGLLHLQLDTYNPTANPVGNSFYGSEIVSRGTAEHGTGLIAEIRARMVTPVKGLVGGAFLYNFFPTTQTHGEIDFELLSNFPDKVQTNIYSNEPLGTGHPEFDGISQLDITQFNNYRVEWWPDRVRWFINNQLIRENTTIVPNEALALHLNFYAPSCDWASACAASLLPASKPEDNKTHVFDVDWVRAIFNVSPQTICLFNWAEKSYAYFFGPANPPTLVWSVYTYRYYADTNTYLGVSSADNHIYYMGQDGAMQDAGALSSWLPVTGCSVGNQATIEFTTVPAYGSTNALSGRVLNAAPDSYQVAVYIKVGPGWWTKPTFAAPLTSIRADGTFTVNITTGGSDQSATEIAAYLVPVGYNLPLMSGGSTLPSTLDSLPKVSVTRSP
ncbi:MAG: glycoside hydrolase family 16 protein [Proteobacteria bacterium]|nr:glycoside hydrolase family 16 protein [Pseudomonadota bacterium]